MRDKIQQIRIESNKLKLDFIGNTWITLKYKTTIDLLLFLDGVSLLNFSCGQFGSYRTIWLRRYDQSRCLWSISSSSDRLRIVLSDQTLSKEC